MMHFRKEKHGAPQATTNWDYLAEPRDNYWTIWPHQEVSGRPILSRPHGDVWAHRLVAATRGLTWAACLAGLSFSKMSGDNCCSLAGLACACRAQSLPSRCNNKKNLGWRAAGPCRGCGSSGRSEHLATNLWAAPGTILLASASASSGRSEHVATNLWAGPGAILSACASDSSGCGPYFFEQNTY